jgi:hypothetical protein
VLPRCLRWLGRGDGDDDTPRVGTILTLAIALAAVYLGNLNMIAPVLTMFFLTTYAVLNASAGIERLLDSPSFRPEFKVHWFFSLLGAAGCIAVMFLINAVATGLAFVFVVIVFAWLQRREMKTTWGDVSQGIWMALIRAGLMRLNNKSEGKTWRPNPLVLSGAPTKRWHLIDFASAITHNRGIMTVATVLAGDNDMVERSKKLEDNIRNFLSERSIQGLVRIVSATDAFKGAEDLVRSYGLGNLVPNTIILGDSENKLVREQYCEMLSNFHNQNRNLVIIHDNQEQEHVFGNQQTIDLWWGGLKGNGGLMIILAYLLRHSRSWLDADVNLKMMVRDEKAAEDAHQNLTGMIKKLRMDFNIEIIVSDGRSFDEVLHASSNEADLIFMGMAEPGDDFVSYHESNQQRLEGLPTTIIVLAAEEISFGEVLMQQDAFEED